MDLPLGGSSCLLFLGHIGIWNAGFYGGRKAGRPQEKPLEWGRELRTN